MCMICPEQNHKMRLLQLHSRGNLTLTDFWSKDSPRYAILSHTWRTDGEEATLQDLLDGSCDSKAGLTKIRLCGEQARHDHLQYFWVDAMCIDKSSSAELSEAINSMYQWYEDAEICYVYLEDLEATEATLDNLKHCRWFTRGWTLQELLAPPKVIFYNKWWTKIGTRRGLAEIISTITGIPVKVFQGSSPLDCTVAQRFSWAADRETTRSEDIAYCLLGLFDVHMAPIYGEGKEKAFIRLQEEILKSHDDQSIFIWTPKHEPRNLGLLATCPSSFCKHPECFDWLQEVMGGPQSCFDPYELFEPAGYYVEHIHSNEANYVESKPRVLKSSTQRIITPSLGPQGLQVSLLVSENIDLGATAHQERLMARTLMTVCFDLVITTDSFYGTRILLQMPFDRVLGFRSQNISRRGLVHRLPALFGSRGSYRLTAENHSFERQTFYVSQQFPTEEFEHPVNFSLASLPMDTEVVEQCFHDLTPSQIGSTPFSSTFNCKGGMISFYHTCSDHRRPGEKFPFIVAFGIHGRKPRPWCYMKSALFGPVTESDVRNLSLTDYFQLVCRSGHFKSACFRRLPCKHTIHTTVLPDEDSVRPFSFRINISFWGNQEII